jgi:thymidylate kinase
MHTKQQRSNVRIISFSGIDGAGKSTQIECIRRGMEELGLRVELVTFWEDIARLKRIREATGHRIFKGDKGVGSPSAPINRRDKNVQSLPMTAVRLALYCVDAISTRLAARTALHSKADVVIFDRYIYDELANLKLSNPFIRAYIRLILSLVPAPDLSYLLDADPLQARARKPEYPVDFLVINRQSYLELSKIVKGIVVVPALPLDEVKSIVRRKGLELFRIENGAGSRRSGAATRNDNAETVGLDGACTPSVPL